MQLMIIIISSCFFISFVTETKRHSIEYLFMVNI